ncbi:MAG: hypothetical protein IT179_10270 [Acidobacteria bacterium]|nr:hypothetical protein [Acidobacteriota bacterium]
MAVNWNSSKAVPPSADVLARVPKARAAKVDASAAPVPASIEQVARRVRAEYQEMPGLCLTRDQARCLWGLDVQTCDRVLSHLVASGFLTCTAHATYVRADGG